MKIDSARLASHLKSGLRPLYVVCGDAPLLLIESADAIRAKASKEGYAEREVFTCEQGFDWNSIIESALSPSLFCPKKVVDLRIPSGKVGTDGAAALQRYVENLQPDVVTLIALPKLDRASRNSKWFGALEKAGVLVEADTVPRSELPSWISARLSAQGQKAGKATLEFLSDRVEGNLLAAHQEIQKLGLLFPEGDLDHEEVRRAVLDVARYDIFQLGEAMMQANSLRFLRILEGLKGEGTAELLVLWQIAEEIRATLRVGSALKSGVSQGQALKDAKIWGSRQQAVIRASGRIGIDRLGEMLKNAAKIDRMIKGLCPGDVWDELRELGLDFAATGRNG
ncbi:MAG: DNA polymerase III subunit delta [Burkholderiales bacterium]|nr:DNA polymerase III subunit delta [Burkholderiales bacterium]